MRTVCDLTVHGGPGWACTGTHWQRWSAAALSVDCRRVFVCCEMMREPRKRHYLFSLNSMVLSDTTVLRRF